MTYPLPEQITRQLGEKSGMVPESGQSNSHIHRGAPGITREGHMAWRRITSSRSFSGEEVEQSISTTQKHEGIPLNQ